jgi:hypothetical protein
LDVSTSHSGHELNHSGNALSRPSGWHPISKAAKISARSPYALFRVKVDAKPVRLQ